MRYRWFCLLRWLGFIKYNKTDTSDLIRLLRQASAQAYLDKQSEIYQQKQMDEIIENDFVGRRYK